VLKVLDPEDLRKRLNRLDVKLAGYPPPEALLERLEALEKKLAAAASPAELVKVVNAHSADLLEVKRVVAEVRTDVAKLNTARSMRAVATGARDG
jgi:hypothetical protein